MNKSLLLASVAVAGLAYPAGFAMILVGLPPFAWLLIMPVGAALLVTEARKAA